MVFCNRKNFAITDGPVMAVTEALTKGGGYFDVCGILPLKTILL